VNSTLNFGLRFAIHVYFFSDHTELFEAVIREHHYNRDVGRVASSGDNDATNSRLIVPGIKAIPATT
jgi:hypothetical protein